MNTDISQSPEQTRSRTKRWLPYFIVAAIVINSFVFLIFIDLFNIFRANMADALNLSYIPAPLAINGEIPIDRIYANMLLVGGFLLVVARDFREKNNVAH